ncbi:PREDICTED: T-cell surface glycoprotein CD8 alpha chain-like, partial [Apaloderma vittatum]|uniref:T-cell surface glycoprotein CD8 alpha chain-like n=1 Tax=Apaloderma vittatum TaxID=57397 RepID=UPI0005217952
MAGSPALLLLLALGLCCPGIHGQRDDVIARFRDNSTKHAQLGQQLELECVTFKEHSGVFWVHQDNFGTNHFIVYIYSTSWTIFEGNKQTSARFEARKVGRTYQLTVKSFTSQDEGNYFCIVNSKQMLYFSHGQPVFCPDTSKEKELRIFCDILWVPLVGACLLLLLAQAATVMLCQ